MRLLIVGADSKYAIERPYLKYLAHNKFVSYVELFAAQNFFLAYYQKRLFNKALYRLKISRILHRINHDLKLKIAECRPDIVFIFKGMEIFPSTLTWIKAKGIRLANYNPDNPFVFSGRGSGNKNITRSIGLFDLFMSYDKDICQKMQTKYHVKSVLLPFGFDISGQLFEVCTKVPEKIKVCFIGNTDVHRLLFLNSLAEAGVEMDLYGMNWDCNRLHRNISFLGPVFEDDLWRTLRSYRVQLNLMRIHNPQSHNMRSFEIPAIGGIQLAPDTADHADYFEREKEIFLYSDMQSCLREIKKILAFTPALAGKIRIQARKRCLTNNYSYKDRAATVAVYLNDLISSN